MLKDLLQGKPLRHPLHPALVHFPIGLFVLSLLLDLSTLVLDTTPGLVRAAFYSMLAGVITALVAAVPGFVDYSDIRQDHPARRTATVHMVLNLVAVAIYGINVGLRSSLLNEDRTPSSVLLLSVAGIGILSISGYLGGHMVYNDGVGVGRHRRKTDLPDETRRLSAADVQQNGDVEGVTFVPVASVDELAQNETLRIAIDHHVIALAKHEGQFHAVQEFCTHRFGPLSEGRIQNGQIQCPWHRSCFDLRTGKPTGGPAKVDLKTYPVQVRDGKVFVGVPRETTAEAPEASSGAPDSASGESG